MRFPPGTMCCLSMWALTVGGAWAGAAPDTKPSRRPADAFERLLVAHSQQVSTLRIKFERKQSNGVTTSVKLDWDIAADLLNGTVLTHRDTPQPDIRVYVRNKELEWNAHPEYAKEQSGTWIVSMSKARQGVIPEQINRSEFALEVLRKAWIPLTVRRVQDFFDELPSNAQFRVSQEEDPLSKQIHRTYTFSRGEKPAARIKYDIDASDGLRIYSTVHESLVTGDADSYRLELGDFRKSNGVYFPFSIKERERQHGKLVVEEEIKVEAVEVNVVFPPTAFDYDPPYGSRVHDTRTNMSYRAGYKNPKAAIGRDGSVTPATRQSATSPDQLPQGRNQKEATDRSALASNHSVVSVSPGSSTVAIVPLEQETTLSTFRWWSALCGAVLLIGGVFAYRRWRKVL